MESKPMTTSEPTTGEIAGAIRVCENKLECDVCPMRDKPCGDLYTLAADRLESQERELVRITDELTALTARAEQAERERDAAIKELTDYEDALYPTVEDVMRDLNTL